MDKIYELFHSFYFFIFVSHTWTKRFPLVCLVKKLVATKRFISMKFLKKSLLIKFCYILSEEP